MIAQLAAAISTYLIGAYAVSAGLRMPILAGTVISLVVWAYLYLRRESLFPV